MTREVATLAHWGAYRLTVDDDGAVTGVRPLVDDPDPSPLGGSFTAATPARIARPAVRRSWLLHGPGAATERRGDEPFVEVPWDVALDLVASELDRVRREHGNEAIFAGSYGWASAGRFHHAQSQLKRFLTLSGGFVSSQATYSHGAAEVAVPRILGLSFGELERAHRPLSEVAEHTELFVSFGGLATGNAQITSGGSARHVVHDQLRAAARRGCRFVTIAPTYGPADAAVDAEWLPIRPGADTAVLLALMSELFDQGLVDEAALRRACAGVDALRDELAGGDDGQPRTAVWAAAHSDLPADRIRALATEMAAHTTMVNGTWSIQRTDHGEQAVWAVVALAAVLGQLDRPGAGFGLGYSSMGSVGAPVCGPSSPALPMPGPNPVQQRIPVARIADALLHPGAAYRFDGEDRRYPDIDLVYWAGGNPFHHHQDLARLARAWQRPSTIIVHEPAWTATARRADVVLPTTLATERRDLGGGSRDAVLVAMEPAVSPPSDARDDHAILASLADRLGFGEAFTQGRSVDDWLTWLYERLRDADPSLPDEATFRRRGWAERTVDASAGRLLDAFVADPDRAPLRTPSGRIELSGRPGAPDDRPRWIEPAEWLGNARPGQLHLLSPQPRHQLHGQADASPLVQAHRDRGRARLEMHPDDAAAHGVASGDVVRVRNDRGRCFASVEVVDHVRPGVVVLPTGAWWDPVADVDGVPVCRRGNPNAVTRDVGSSSWAQATSAHTCLVEVEPAPDAPAPAPHAPPPIVPRAPTEGDSR